MGPAELQGFRTEPEMSEIDSDGMNVQKTRKRQRKTSAEQEPDSENASGAQPADLDQDRKRYVPSEKRLLRKLREDDDVSDASSDSDEQEQDADAEKPTRPVFRNKEKVLLLTSKGIPPRFRHLMLDLTQLLPHSKKDAKLDTKSQRNVINEVADMKGCSSVVFFEARKHQDLYVWIAKSPNGPSVKFHCTNVHTMAELKLSGNHLKGSRPVLSFNKEFDEQPHWQLMREMLTHIFTTPKGHPRSKPFVDHVINFAVADGRIWVRNYQVVCTPDKKKVTLDALSLVEVGPRMTLNPIAIFSGSFSGPKLYSNPNYVSPNVLRAEARKEKAGKYGSKLRTKQKRKQHAQANPLPVSELADVFK